MQKTDIYLSLRYHSPDLHMYCVWIVRAWMSRRPVVTIVCAVVLVTIGYKLLHGDRTRHSPLFEEPRKLTPPMGWNSWNKFRCDGLHESLIHEIADSLVQTGLAKAGYVYVNLDDCWEADRNSSGHIQWDKDHFPSGMKSLGNKLHSMGLKFGIYTDVGSLTCQRRPGSYGHETIDAETFVSWGVDFVKNDDCSIYPGADITSDYRKMWDALRQTGRDVIHSIKAIVPPSDARMLSNMRRVSGDIYDEWEVMLSLIDKAVADKLDKYSAPGFWNDLDMLEIGNGGMTQNEYIAHMALWCAFKAPLLLGNDIRNIDSFTKQLLTHDEFLAVHADPLGKSVELVRSEWAVGNHASSRIVSRPCDEKDLNHLWYYNEKNQFLHYSQNNKCATVSKGNVNYLVVDNCVADDERKLWRVNNSKKQIHSLLGRSLCFTTSTNLNVDARMRSCEERRGPNRLWRPWKDAYLAVSQEMFQIRNAKNMCATVGAPMEINIFTGHLSNNKFVAVLLNRDSEPQSVSLRLEDLSAKSEEVRDFIVRDLYNRKDGGTFVGSYTTVVPGHYAMMLTLRHPDSSPW